jgi:hypothetical protein
VDAWIRLSEKENQAVIPRSVSPAQIGNWCKALNNPNVNNLSERFIEGKLSRSENAGLRQAHELLGENLPLPPPPSSSLLPSSPRESESTSFTIPPEPESQSPFIKGT